MTSTSDCEGASLAGGGDVEWHDGDMPYSRRFGDHYYSRSDGRAECRHVFLDGNRLPERFAVAEGFTIGELGFGTGLNLVETWRLWKEVRPPSARLRFLSFEMFPLTAAEMERALSAWAGLEEEVRALLASWPERHRERILLQLDPQTALDIRIGEASEGLAATAERADAWFLDGFAPARNPSMWTDEILCQVFGRTVPGGTFATYSAAGHVRRGLASAGFRVERLPGHASKREMLAGCRPANA